MALQFQDLVERLTECERKIKQLETFTDVLDGRLCTAEDNTKHDLEPTESDNNKAPTKKQRVRRRVKKVN